MNSPIRRVALSTGGGGAPGLNATIRGATIAAVERGWDVVGIRNGFDGIMNAYNYSDGVRPLTRETVRGIAGLGGTILGLATTENPFGIPVRKGDGSWDVEDRSQLLLETLENRGIDALILVGGDGFMRLGHALCESGLRVVGVPISVDNDVDPAMSHLGTATSVSVASDCIDRLFSTSVPQFRIFVVEVMGRMSGWTALHAGVACGAHVVLIPEVPYDLDSISSAIVQRHEREARFAVVVVAEGATGDGGELSVGPGTLDRGTGIGERVAAQLSERTGYEARTLTLGHLLSSGEPTPADRLIRLRLGAAAVRALEQGQDGVMVSLDPPGVRYEPLGDVHHVSVPLDCEALLAARDLGICLGDSV